jgi:hypothetical protein
LKDFIILEKKEHPKDFVDGTVYAYKGSFTTAWVYSESEHCMKRLALNSKHFSDLLSLRDEGVT